MKNLNLRPPLEFLKKRFRNVVANFFLTSTGLNEVLANKIYDPENPENPENHLQPPTLDPKYTYDMKLS